MYIRYKTYKRKCPHCEYVYYKSDIVDDFQIGSPLRLCKKCQRDFIDTKYLEPSAFEKYITKPQKWHPFYKTIILFLFMQVIPFLVLAETCNIEILGVIVVFEIFALIGISVTFLIKVFSYNSKVKKWKNEYNQSFKRLNDEQYMKFLYELYHSQKGLIIKAKENGEIYLDSSKVFTDNGTKTNFKNVFGNITNGKGLVFKRTLMFMHVIAILLSMIFSVLANASKEKEAADFFDTRFKKENLYSSCAGTVLCAIAENYDYNEDTGEKLSESSEYYVLIVDDKEVENAEHMGIVLMTNEQYEEYGIEGEEYEFYGVTENVPDEIYKIFIEDEADYGIIDSTILDWKMLVGNKCLKMLDEPKMEFSVDEIITGIVMVMLWITLWVLTILYVDKYGIIIKRIYGEYDF